MRQYDGETDAIWQSFIEWVNEENLAYANQVSDEYDDKKAQEILAQEEQNLIMEQKENLEDSLDGEGVFDFGLDDNSLV